MLGNAGWGFPSPDRTQTPEKAAENLPLREVWEKWYSKRPKALRDRDGLELFRLAVWSGMVVGWQSDDEWQFQSAERKQIFARLTGGNAKVELKYVPVVKESVDWLLFLHPAKKSVDFLLDAVETSFALLPPKELNLLTTPLAGSYDWDWRSVSIFSAGYQALSAELDRSTRGQIQRAWQLAQWRDEPMAGAVRDRPGLPILEAAYDHGFATLADFADTLLGPDVGARTDFTSLARLTARKPEKDHEKFLAKYSEIRDLVEACRTRIVEIEIARGETATAATAAAHALQSLWGMELLLKLIEALGKQGFKVVSGYRNKGAESKPCTLTHLISVTYPLAGETPEKFSPLARQAMKAGWLTEKILLELAFLAPQWVKHIAAALGWSGFDEALYWFLAHMRYASATENAAVGAGVEDAEKSQSDAADEDADKPKPSAWERLIAERTPLSDADRRAGAVDVAWFRTTYEGISPKRWQAMAAAARFAANAAQAKHAQFVADVLTGKASRKQLIDGIRKKQLKDHVRLLGLYPLASGGEA